MHPITRFLADESGLSIVEYAVAGALIVAGIVLAFVTLGDSAAVRIGETAQRVQGN